MTEELNDMTPKESAGYWYHEAQNALGELLDASPEGWSDIMVMVRRLATKHRAIIMERMFDALRPMMDEAARQQDQSNQWTGQPDPDDRLRDATL